MGGERSVSPADMRFNHSRDHPGVSDSVNTDCELKQIIMNMMKKNIWRRCGRKVEKKVEKKGRNVWEN